MAPTLSRPYRNPGPNRNTYPNLDPSPNPSRNPSPTPNQVLVLVCLGPARPLIRLANLTLTLTLNPNPNPNPNPSPSPSPTPYQVALLAQLAGWVESAPPLIDWG